MDSEDLVFCKIIITNNSFERTVRMSLCFESNIVFYSMIKFIHSFYTMHDALYADQPYTGLHLDSFQSIANHHISGNKLSMSH